MDFPPGSGKKQDENVKGCVTDYIITTFLGLFPMTTAKTC